MSSNKKVIILLPARYSSKRIKNKLLKNLNGIPLIIHTILRVKMIKNGIWERPICIEKN